LNLTLKSRFKNNYFFLETYYYHYITADIIHMRLNIETTWVQDFIIPTEMMVEFWTFWSQKHRGPQHLSEV
jgi:hypothetical protein